LVEEGASDSVKDRLGGIMWGDDELIMHASAMNRMYQLLRQDLDDDQAMSDEEAQMFIVKCYGDSESRKLFTSKKGPDVASLRKESGYKTFRADYEKLKKFEAIENDDPSLERERIDMARDLRTALITGTGLSKDHTGTLSDVIDKNIRYMERSAKIAKILRRRVEEEVREKDLSSSEVTIDRRVFSLRRFFLNRLILDCKENDAYDPEKWEKEIDDIRKNDNYWDNMEFRRDSISSAEYKKAEKARIETGIGEEHIAEAIRKNVYLFKGRLNKYEKLDEDQKKIFAVALMLMDKGSIGMDTAGTSALLTPQASKKKETSKIEEELGKYVAGKPWHIDVDYKEAFNKLVNYGETKAFYIEAYTLSKSAYDRALQFAQAITAKKLAFGEKDTLRMNDGVSSINAAYTKYGKKQQQELEKYRDTLFTTDDVRNTLLSYAEADTDTYREIAKKVALAGISYKRRMATLLDEGIRFKRRMDRITKRFRKMDNSELQMFVRIMQERSLIDRTMIPKTAEGEGPDYADQQKRNALLEALSADPVTRSEVLRGFDDNDSCHKALVSALSFQLRDDINFKGKDLTKDHFEKRSFNRTTMVDWELVERAFDLIDEVKEKRASIYALRHATDFIEQSGNEKAIAENKKLERQFKEKEKFKESDFEKYIRQQAEKDASEEEDVSRVVAGFHALTDKEKSLFFKVLARRDLLDISRKDYNKSFFGIKDRNYVNQA
ncbi:MAG: hypothetical protein IK088_01485, partial [Lachnospiraceae bacterium]|nr:hypothetical protein [Lachnospiraceae bacterium]